MKYCNKCHVDISGHLNYCPLCQNELTDQTISEREENLYPAAYEVYTSHHMLLKILGFISITIIILSLLINYLVSPKVWWSIVVIVSTGFLWLSLTAAIYKHRNILKYMLYQSIIFCLFAIFIDIYTGFHAWSISFVIPVVFTLMMIVMYMLSKILHLHAGDYVIYLLLDALFGIPPFIFIFIGNLKTYIPCLICITISFLSVIGLIIFEGRTIYEELNRRLHI